MNRIFMVTTMVTILSGAMCGAAEADGTPSLWSLSPEEIQAAYPTAAVIKIADGSGYEIKSATLGGVRWNRIQLRFDRNRQLVHMKLWTRQRSYEQMEASLADSNGDLWAIGDDAAARAAAQKVMLCDYGTSGVALSFDQPSVALPQTITASIAPEATLR